MDQRRLQEVKLRIERLLNYYRETLGEADACRMLEERLVRVADMLQSGSMFTSTR